MRKLPALALLLALVGAAPDRKADVDVSLAGPGGATYQVAVDGRTKKGRLPAQPGTVTVLDSVELDGASAGAVAAAAAFADERGVISRCAPVAVALTDAGASCLPSFVVTPAPAGLGVFICQSSCVAARRAER